MCYFSTLLRTALQFSTQTQFQVVGQDCFAGLYRDSANRQKSTLAALSGGCTRKYQHEQALLIISLRFALSLEKIGYTRKYQHEQALLIISLVCTIVG